MSEPSPAPSTDAIPNLEPSNPATPAQGAGLIHTVEALSNKTLHLGRVEDVYMGAFCAIVSLYGYRAALPCIWLQGAMNRWRGVKDLNPPSVGTEVLVWAPPDGKYGIIFGTTNAPSDGVEKPSMSLMGTPVDRTSKSEIHDPKEWRVDHMLPGAQRGVPTDVLPGDSVQINEMGAFNALLMFMNVMQGSDACKFEAFVLDDLARLTAFNLQIRTSMGETNVMNDHGAITEESSGSHLLNESLGGGHNESVPEGRETLLRRFQDFRGYLGGLIQNFIVKPFYGSGNMDLAKSNSDIGMAQKVETLGGWVVQRSIAGGGQHKTLQIAVPKKIREADDPEGDHGVQEPKPLEAFSWSDSPGTPAAIACQLRDYFAWQFNRILPQRFLERKGDWTVPEENSCPAPLKASSFKTPSTGEFFRDFPEKLAALAAVDGIPSSVNDLDDGFEARAGEAWSHVLPDGSVSMRDAWGSGIEMRGGHVDITASKDIRVFAGGSIVIMGGDDVVIKARQAVDISSSENQVRIRSEREMFIHSENGGMLISLGSAGSSFVDASGEKRKMPGICVKVPNQGGFIVDAGQATFNLSNRFFVSQGSNGNYPDFLVHSRRSMHWLENGAVFAIKQDDKYVLVQDSNVFTNGRLQVDKSILCTDYLHVEGDMTCSGKLAGQGSGESNLPYLPVSSQPPDFQYSFGDWTPYQFPYTIQELAKVEFCFRTQVDYATAKGKWFETFWQREMSDLGTWTEKAAKDGSYPYPGREHYSGTKEFWTYREGNVENNGRPKSRNNISKSGGTFSAKSWQGLPVHPSR